MCVCSKSVCKKYRAEGVYYCRYIQFIRISVFVQSRRVHLFIVNCLLKNNFNIHVIYQHYKSNYHAKNIIWLEFTRNYSLFKLNYNWQHCSAISLNVVMLCVCTKRVCVCDTELVCKAVRLAFSCKTSAISIPFILLPWISLLIVIKRTPWLRCTMIIVIFSRTYL